MNSINIVCIVQARLGSKRLPGKVLKKINNKNSIEIIYSSLKKSKKINKIIFAVPKNNNAKLINFLKIKRINYFLGSENNVLKRFYDTAKFIGAKHIVRITADCPLLDIKLIDKMIDQYLNSKFDYASNTIFRTFPDGLDAEIFKFESLKNAYLNSKNKHSLEHVTPYLIQSPKIKRYIFRNKVDYSFLRVTLDTKQDFILIKKIFAYYKNKKLINFNDIVNLYKIKPNLFNKNIVNFNNELSETHSGNKLYQNAKKIIPGGTMLLTKKPEMFLPNKWPSYFSRTKDVNIWDLDNKKYIDFSYMGVGTNILGYSNSEVDSAVRKTIANGNMSTLNCSEEVLLADKLISIHPWADMVRFARTGGEANAIAIRIARSSTSKQNIAVCGYHGWHDWYLALNLSKQKELDNFLIKDLNISGVSKKLKNSIFSFNYNDFNALIKLIENKNIGIIKMEVMRNILPKNNFLQKIRKICDEKNIILIFDECTSGFRENFGGIHKIFKVNPDLCMFSKALGNGYAISAVLGKKEFMNKVNNTFISSTFWTERIGPTAALKTLEVMQKKKSWKIIKKKGKYIKTKWKLIFDKYNINVEISGIDALPSFRFIDYDQNYCKTFITQEMLRFNILATDTVYVSIKHTYKLIDKYLYYFELVISQLKQFELEKIISNKPFVKNLSFNGLKRMN